MKIVETEIEINAAPQTVWSILDDLARYHEWNPIVPKMEGKTTVDSQLSGQLVILDKVDKPFPPTITRIVGARQFRWITVRHDPADFSAEHCFTLTPTDDGGTHLAHYETFEGRLVEGMWPLLDTAFREAYVIFNCDLKTRAEAMTATKVSLHPDVDDGITPRTVVFSETTLKCQCPGNQVEVKLGENIAHNHLCGCSKCWKPEGALFAQVAVTPEGTAEVSANEEKLVLVDNSQAIQRHACRECGVHMLGRVEDKNHHFYGLTFIHPELAVNKNLPAPTFAAFVSSLIESGACPSEMEAVRKRLSERGLPAYDAFTPELMDIIAWHKVKLAKHG